MSLRGASLVSCGPGTPAFGLTDRNNLFSQELRQLSIASHLLNQSWLLGCYYHSVERVFSVEHIPHVVWLLNCSH